MAGPAVDESRERKRQRVCVFPASDDLDFSVACPFSDVKLVSADGTVLYGCRYTLAKRSPVCKQMLLGGMREAQPLAMSDVVTIPFPGMRTETLQVLLEFCTSAGFSEKPVPEAPADIIHAARYFHLTDDMEELIRSVMETLSLPPGAGMVSLAATLSVALEFLPTDLETSFFEILLKKIFSRSICDLPFGKLSCQALEFLLSKTLQCSEAWASGCPFYSSEYDIFLYVLQWSGRQISEDAQQRLEQLYDGTPTDETFHIDDCEPGTAEVLEKAATIAGPFFPFIDFRLIHPDRIAQDIEPLNIVPEKMLLAAMCHHHTERTSLRSPIMYRGPYVLQWSPYGCGSGFIIDDYADGRHLYCVSDTAGFARTYSCLKGSGEHSWTVIVSNFSCAKRIGIGFCPDSEVTVLVLLHLLTCRCLVWQNFVLA